MWLRFHVSTDGLGERGWHALKDEHREILREYAHTSKTAFHGESQYSHPPSIFLPLLFWGLVGKKAGRMLSGIVHTPSPIVKDLPCNPVLADVKGPWGPNRDVLTQPPWAVGDRSSQLCYSPASWESSAGQDLLLGETTG